MGTSAQQKRVAIPGGACELCDLDGIGDDPHLALPRQRPGEGAGRGARVDEDGRARRDQGRGQRADGGLLVRMDDAAFREGGLGQDLAIRRDGAAMDPGQAAALFHLEKVAAHGFMRDVEHPRQLGGEDPAVMAEPL
nr:hypothetical protein [Cereibacter sphaeroides]